LIATGSLRATLIFVIFTIINASYANLIFISGPFRPFVIVVLFLIVVAVVVVRRCGALRRPTPL
jgi:hypothetical protein